MMLLAFQFLLRPWDRLFGAIDQNIAKINSFRKKRFQLFKGFDLLPSFLFSWIRNQESVLEKRECFLDGSGNRTLINIKQVFKK